MLRPRVALAIAIAVALLAPAPASADRAVRGTVVDDATGAPVAGALVAVGGGETATDDAGRFRVAEVPFGRVEVVVIADGYRTYFGSARIGVDLAIRLEPSGGSNDVIRVSGRSLTAPPLHLDTAAIRNQPGAGNDVLRALQSLPGVARTPFGLGGLALRGTAPRDTKVYLDGIEVPLLYHFGGIASFLPTAAIDEVTLEPGGASVRYGRGLGGVAVVTSRTGRRDRWARRGRAEPDPRRGGRRGARTAPGELARRRAALVLRRDHRGLQLPRRGDAVLRRPALRNEPRRHPRDDRSGERRRHPAPRRPGTPRRHGGIRPIQMTSAR